MPPIEPSYATPVATTADPATGTAPPSADLDGNGILDPHEQQQAALQFAPVLYFAPGEENFPADPLTCAAAFPRYPALGPPDHPSAMGRA